jgi:hypothetical protein
MKTKRKIVRKAKPAPEPVASVQWFGTTNPGLDPYWEGYGQGRKAGAQDALDAVAKLLVQMQARPRIDSEILTEFDAAEEKREMNRRLAAIEAKLTK